MFSHRLTEPVSYKTYFDWLLLSFLAGNINTGGYLACYRFVSHVTGFATLAGISLHELNWFEAFGALTIPLFFLMGVMLSGYLTEKNKSVKIHGQKYAPVMWISGLLLGVVAAGGYNNYFGSFGEMASMKHDYILLACLCGACGLQNAAISSASGATIRTTHLTGLTTDLGLGIIRSKFHEMTGHERQIEKRSNLLRAATIISFILGSLVGAAIYSQFKYEGFFFPMLIAFYAAWTARQG